jgi:hypothetical protein
MGLRTFPSVNTRVLDDSFFSNTTSRFRCGLIGPASKGPVNVATGVRSIRDFFSQFGPSLPGVYLAAAVQMTAEISDNITVVRVAHPYETLQTSGASASGSANATVVNTPNAVLFQADDYVRVSQIGKVTTVNARVISKTSSTLNLDPATPLADTYTAATVDRSRNTDDPILGADAANEAEAFLKANVWSATGVGGVATEATVSGNKNEFEVEVETNTTQLLASDLAPGDLVKLQQVGLKTSRELMVKEVIPNVPGVKAKITFEPVNRSDVGYQALGLQDTYTGAKIFKRSGSPLVLGYHLLAAMPGTWANSDGVTTGLIVKVAPGTQPDTKKLRIYENSGLVEEIDNLSSDSASPNFFVTRVNGLSAFINFALANPEDPTSLWLGGGTIEPPANTVNPWITSLSKVNVAAFKGGFNGENVTDADYFGTIDPVTELPSGLKIFEDKDNNIQVDVLAAPGVSSINVAFELDRINREINTMSVFDVPRGLNARQAIDWQASTGLFKSNGLLDTYTIALYWNWITIVDAFTGNRIVVPPSCGALRAMAFTFDAFKPWFVAAGETRGLIPEALAVEFPRVSDDAKNAMYRNGNVINPILINRQRIMVFGDTTTQRVDSKLADVHSVILVNTVLQRLTVLGRKYLFDPIDDILITQMYQDFKGFMDGIKNDRGVEDFLVVMDKTNNSADDRNNRRVNVQVQMIPESALEQLNITAVVRESGATLVAAT